MLVTGVTGCFSILEDGEKSGLGASCPLLPVTSCEAVMFTSLMFSIRYFALKIYCSANGLLIPSCQADPHVSTFNLEDLGAKLSPSC